MTDHLTPADFAAVPWGGRAIPPEGSAFTDAIRVPGGAHDTQQWTLRGDPGMYPYHSDTWMADNGWTLPAKEGPWDNLLDHLQEAWDEGEEREGADEHFVYLCDDGTLLLGFARSEMSAQPYRRFRPRPRPSWQDAEVVEAALEDDGVRRRFLCGVAGWISTSGAVHEADDLIDPVPMTVQKKEER